MILHVDLFIILSAFLTLFFSSKPVHGGGAVGLTNSNFDSYVAKHELVFLNFYADWCRFSNILAPVFDESADKISQEFPQPGRVLFGKVDCDAETSLASRFHITKYPTLKVVRHGKSMKREFRGQRSADSLVAYIRDLLKDPILEMTDSQKLEEIEEKKQALVAHFDSKDSPHYDTMRKVAMDLRDDCNFFITIGNLSLQRAPNGNTIIFKPSRTKLGTNDEAYPGDLLSYDELSAWATLRCIPLVREITFENAEELTEEGLPFLILFHHPDDKESVEVYTNEIQKQLPSDKNSMNFLTADGLKFSHPLHHLGKTNADLPLIAIDSFRHMYLFHKFEDIKIAGKLKQFLDDLYSGKLHREFHYGPDPTTNAETDSSAQQPNYNTDPPESTFRKLAPSRNRYTLLRDEL